MLIDLKKSELILYGLIALVAIIIIIVVICCIASAKKKKPEVKVEETKVEEVSTEEIKEEPKEETKVEESPIEEIKEEPKEEKEEVAPAVEEPKKEVAQKVSKKKVERQPKKVEEVKEEPTPKAKAKTAGKYVLVQEGANWRYKLKASNGEVIIVSEPYTSEKAVRNGIETLRKNIEVSRCDIIEDKHGLFSFRVITKQGRCLATSANYKTKARAESASESYKRWALSETVIMDDNGSADHMEVEKIEVEIKEEHNGKYLIKDERNGFIYQLIASNGRIIATSNSYKSKESCLEACEKFRVCVYDGSFYVYKDKNNRYQFKLYNKQNRLVLAGEVYDEKNRAIAAIEAIKRVAKYAVVVDTVIETEPQEVNA